MPHRVGCESSSWYLRGGIARIVESPHESIEPCPRGDRQSLAMGGDRLARRARAPYEARGLSSRCTFPILTRRARGYREENKPSS